MKPKGNHWFIVFDKKMEELYNYVRFGDRKKRLYDYKVELRTQAEANEFYKLLKALFILNTEMPHYYKFKLKVNYLGGLDFIYGKKKITYDSLMELLVKEYENMKNQINNS